MDNFSAAYGSLIGVEGTYSNHPDDRGGETYKGISRVYEPSWYGWNIIDDQRDVPGFPENLSHTMGLEYAVREFYRATYWDYFSCASLPYEVAYELFEISVNMGKRVATEFLQRALNAFNKKGTLWKDIAIDGVFGPKTLEATKDMCNARDCTGTDALAKALNCQQGERYITLSLGREQNESFTWGWFSRV